RGHDGVAEAIGGTADHIHVLCGLKPAHTLADFVRELKKASSIWASERHETAFAWQEGYAAFTVRASSADIVRNYIINQEQHHRRFDFRKELELLLVKHGVEFRPEYLDWY